MQVTEIMRKLSPADISEMAAFLNAEVFNKSPLRTDAVRLFEVLRKCHPELSEADITKDKVYAQLFPGKPPITGKLEKTASELNKLIRDFLLWKYYQSEEQEFTRALHWGRVLRQLELPERYEQHLNKIDREILAKEPQSPLLYYQRFQLEYEQFDRLSALNKGREDINLPATIDSLTTFFEVYRLDFLNNLLLQQRLTQLHPDESMLNIPDERAQAHLDSPSPILQISARIHLLLKKARPELEDFSRLMELLNRHAPSIAPPTLRDYYTHLRNFCTVLINTNQHNELWQVLHHIHKDNLERGYLHMDNKLMATTLLNINRTAIRQGNFPWLLEVLESHRGRIIGEGPEEAYFRTNKALCWFSMGRYQDALDIIPPACDNILYYLLARRLEIMCYYELRSEITIYKVEAFRMYIRRAGEKFLSSSLYNPNMAFGNMIHQILLTPPRDKARSARIIGRIQSKEEIAEVAWLLEKAKALV